MSHADVFDLEQSNPNIPTQFDADTGSAIPVGNLLNVNGLTVANGTRATPLHTVGSGNTVTWELQVATTLGAAPADSNDAGIVSFDSSQFTVDANGFVQLVGASAAIDSIAMQSGTSPVVPDGAGLITFNGAVVASGTTPVQTNGTGANTMQLEIQRTQAFAATDANRVGLASFDSAQFTVDANGYVQLAGGGGAAMLTVTGDDATAISPSGGGNIDLQGSTVANATNAKPVFVDGTAVSNLLEVEVQVGAAVTGAPGDVNDAGLVSFNDTQFTVSANGYVALVGGTDLPSIQTLTGDDGTAVGPDANGDINLDGIVVANATNAKPLFFDNEAANVLRAELQVSAAITGAPGDTNDAGIASFNDTQFTVDANGYVALVGGADLPSIQTLTGDSGGAIGPDANGNITLTGGPGITITGSGNALTVNSVVYTDQAGSTTVTSDSGSFSTAAITLTTPASPAQGELLEFVASTADALEIQLNGTQVAHLGNSATSAGGTITSNAIGDSLILRYQSSTDDWWAIGGWGNWTLA